MRQRWMLGVAVALACGVAGAATAEPLKVSGSVVLGTDYMSKGASKNGEPALSANLDVASGALYAGTWVGDVMTSQGGDVEAHLYLGAKPKWGGVQWDLRAMAKTIQDSEPGVQENYAEFRADASRSFGRTKARLRVEYSPDSYAATRQAWWFEGQISHPISDEVTASAALGRREQAGGSDYTAWNAGAVVEITDRIELDLRWYDTDAHELGRAYRGQAVAALAFRF